MAIDKIFNDENIDGIADNIFNAVNNSVSEVKQMQQRKAAENAQMVVQALKKIDSDLRSRFEDVGNAIEKRVASIKDGRDGINGKNGRDGKDGKSGKDGATGPAGRDGVPGRDGVDGDNGTGVASARIDFDGSLVIVLDNGREINVGEVVPFDVAERIKVISNGGGTSQYVLDTLASLQAQISAISGGLSYQGTWNASTNTPTLTSSSGTSNYYYVVSVSGSTNLNGITDWVAGDWAIYNGTVWQKIDQTNLVISVAGRTGAITLTTADIGGLGTIATQAANNVSITGGSITGITALTATGNAIISDNSANAALRITQIGTGNALLVEDSTNPDATPFVVDASGNVVSGNTSFTATTLGNAKIQTVGLGAISAFYSAADANGPIFEFAKTRSAIVQNADEVGQIRFSGFDGASYIRTASISSAVDGTPGTNDMPGRLVFSTTADGASSPTERMRISSTGQTTISGNAIISTTDNTNAALRITQLGTGNALLVEDSTNPDSTPVVIDASGKLAIGNTSVIEYATGVSPALQVLGTAASTSAAMVGRFSADANGAPLIFLKSRGALGAQGVVASGDIVANIQMWASDGTSNIQAASIVAAVDGTPGTNDMPGRLVFSTTADGASTPTERIRIDSAGNMGLGVTPSAWTVYKALQVNGSVFANSGASTAFIGSNWFYDGADKYIASNYATIYRQNAGSHSWLTAPSGTAGNAITFTQAMTLDASGNLGIGTTSPINNGGYGGFSLNGTSGALLSMMTNGTESSRIASVGNETSIQCKASTGFISFVSGVSGGTERARIDSSGRLLLGTTSAPTGGAVSTWQNSGSTRWSMGPNGGSAFVLFNPSDVGCYVVDGQTGWTGTSDGTLKNVIAPITNGLTSIIGLKPTIYSWKSDEENTPYAGLIAQEVQSVLPDLVNDNNGTLGVNYTGVIPYLISAIQEQQALITTLTARITALESA